MTDCNCPPLSDVLSEGVGTKEPCPVHDKPELQGLLKDFLPRLYDSNYYKIQPMKPDTRTYTARTTAKGRARRN